MALTICRVPCVQQLLPAPKGIRCAPCSSVPSLLFPPCAQVRGYLPLDLDVAPGVAAEVDFSEQQAAVAELAQRKQELMYELASYQNSRTQAAVPVRGKAGRRGGVLQEGASWWGY